MTRKRLFDLLTAGAVVLVWPFSWARAAIAAAFAPRVSAVVVVWEGVQGATGYEIAVDGQVLKQVGRNARSARVSVSSKTLIEIIDLPARSLVQEIDFAQESR